MVMLSVRDCFYTISHIVVPTNRMSQNVCLENIHWENEFRAFY